MNSSLVAATLLVQMGYVYLSQNTMIYLGGWELHSESWLFKAAEGPWSDTIGCDGFRPRTK
jgi:hypothetical protein